MRCNGRERYVNLIQLRSLDSNKEAGPLWNRRGCEDDGGISVQEGKLVQTASTTGTSLSL